MGELGWARPYTSVPLHLGVGLAILEEVARLAVERVADGLEGCEPDGVSVVRSIANLARRLPFVDKLITYITAVAIGTSTSLSQYNRFVAQYALEVVREQSSRAEGIVEYGSLEEELAASATSLRLHTGIHRAIGDAWLTPGQARSLMGWAYDDDRRARAAEALDKAFADDDPAQVGIFLASTEYGSQP